MSKLRSDRAVGFIETADDLQRGIRALRRRCEHMRRIHDLTGDPPLRRYAPGFEGLARIIVGQQLSIASAEAIWSRTRAAIQPFTAATLRSMTDEQLRGAGLSRSKVRTLRALADRVDAGAMAIAALAQATEEEAHGALTAVPGIGPWTADIFLLFCAGRTDAWASGDLALQIAAQRMLELDTRPSAGELTLIAERWRPHRGVAARLLWAYYRISKDPRSAAPV